MKARQGEIVQEALHKWASFANGAKECAAAGVYDVHGLNGSASAFFIREVYALLNSNAKSKKPVIIVTSGEREAASLCADLRTVLSKIRINMIPWWGTIPYRAAAVSSPVFGERAAALCRLASGEGGVFITTERAFLSPLPPAKHITQRAVTFSVQGGEGQSVDTAQAAKMLARMGYTRVPRVHVHGEFSIRGEVIDIFLHGDDESVRIKLDYDKIMSIKHFDADTQLATVTLESAVAAPAREVGWDSALVQKLRDGIAQYDNSAIEMPNAQHSTLNTYYAPDRGVTGGNEAYAECPPLIIEHSTLDTPRLPFTDKARERLVEMLDELEINGCAEGEELLYPLVFESATLADYAKDALLILMEKDRLSNSEAAIMQENTAMYRKARADIPCLPPADMIIPLDSMLSRFPHRISFHTLASETIEESSQDIRHPEGGVAEPSRHPEGGGQSPSLIQLKTEPSRSFFGNINFLKETLSSLKKDGWKTVVFAGGETQSLRIKAMLKGEDEKPLASVLPDAIAEGFSVIDIKLLVIQEGEMFGRKRRGPPLASRKARSEAIDTFVELNPGDYVVHVDYGIGIFRSIDRVKALGHERDYITIEYADGDKVFVPTEQVNLVQRYIGSSGAPPRLDKIGTKSWEKRKGRTAQAVEEMAQKLLDIYARRQASVGHAFDKDGEWQASFEAAFPYEDTSDQTTVTEEIKRDMERPLPMDRLICGDVGYGKTEVAMRAAFKAVMGGAQVAFLAPTTILSEQHYETLLDRFKGFPVKIALLSRFVTPAEQKQVLRRLADGDVDILVGTHRIIQNDVHFKQLGLLIIDEEQRFGVKDKERLKSMRSNIDCLAMSATPIPRTLHMSLLKIRDMSLLTTPPQNRQAVETSVEPYSDERVAASIRREVMRGGQVFYLHNRVESLNETRLRIERLVPEMMVECAHGTMSADSLDDIFRRFKAGAFHVLVSTTIIENGIDIPNVNTIIIDRADMYGISQLYQLRGRVGRSDRKAYAYLLYPEKKALSEVAMKRLEAISDFTELGSGFKIAMKDMEIRGAGNLLGRDQSGEICSVGFDMYMRLLSQAVDRLKQSKDYKEADEVLLEINYSGFIPDTYIDSSQIKMEVYKEIASARDKRQIERTEASLIDRFGPIPPEVNALLALSEVKEKARAIHVCSIKETKDTLVIEAASASAIKIDRLLTLIKENPATISLSPKESNKIFLKCAAFSSDEKIQYLIQVLERLA